MTATDCPAADAARPPLTDAERWEMVQGVRPLAVKLVREGRVPFDDQDDVSQDALLELHKAAGRFERGRGTWANYAAQTVKTVIADYRRKRAGDGRGGAGIVLPTVSHKFDPRSIADDRPDPADQVAEGEELDAAAGADLDDWRAFAELLREAMQAALLDRLTPLSRDVVRLVLSGLSPDQVAVQLGRAPKDVKLAIRNAMRRLTLATDPAKRSEHEARKAATKERQRERQREKARQTRETRAAAAG